MCKMAGEHAFNLKFVGEVEKLPELYNYNLPQYSRKDLVEKAWVEVGKEMNISAKECKERWTNVRSVFVRNLKSPPSGSGSKIKKPYYLMEAMQFALTFVKTHKPVKPGNVPQILEQFLSQFDEDIDDMLENPGQSQLFRAEASPLFPSIPLQLAPDLSSQQTPSLHSQQPPLSQPPTGLIQPSNLIKKKPGPKRGISTTDVDSTFMHFLQKKTARLDTPKEKDKKTAAIKSFLDSLFPELEPLTEDQLKKFRRKVFQLINDITDQTPEIMSNLSYHSSTSSYSSPPHIITIHQMEPNMMLNNENESTTTSGTTNSFSKLVSMATEEPE